MPAGDRVRVGAQRAADGDRQLADLERRRVAERRRRQAGRLDLDDGQVGERVDAVDRAVEVASVLELDGRASPLPATTWRLVRIQPFESKMMPEPTPSAGMRERVVGSASAPLTVIVTTAGLTLAARR